MSAVSQTSAGIERQPLPPEIEQKYQRLRGILAEMPSLLVAYSGGVDSALLLKVASDVLGERALGVIATSPAYEGAETAEALHNAEAMGARVLQIETHEMENERYVANGLDRCYHCKTELFTRLEPLARERGIALIAYRLNRDELGDFRPGQRAAREFGVRAPLQEADLGKQEI